MSITTIEWTKRPGTIGETWNPVTGCNKVNRGCKNCYAEIMHKRLQAMGQEKYKQDFLKGAVEHPDTLGIPLTWKKPRTVFVNSMSDLFHAKVSFQFIARVFAVMEATPQHTYLILTKRPEHAVDFFIWLREIGGGCPLNVWMGTSCNNQQSAAEMVPYLLEIDCKVRFLSYEPATGPLDLTRIDADAAGHEKFCMINALTGRHTDMARPCADVGSLHWVIAGGESGRGAVPADPAWFRTVRDQCKAAGVPFFFKQFGNWHPVRRPGSDREDHPERYFYFDPSQRCGMGYGNTEGQWMKRTPTKSLNVLDGERHQAFPY